MFSLMAADNPAANGGPDAVSGQIQLGRQFRTPHAAFRNQRLTGTLQVAGEWRGNETNLC
jgi:hypothetical protein